MLGPWLGALGSLTAGMTASAGALELEIERLPGSGLVSFFRSTEDSPEPIVDHLGRWYAQSPEGEPLQVAQGATTTLQVPTGSGFPAAPHTIVQDLVVGSPSKQTVHVRSAQCPPLSNLKTVLGAVTEPLCDHQVHRVLSHSSGLLIAGRLNPSVGRSSPVPWLGVWSGQQLAEVSPAPGSVGLDAEIFDLVEGRSGVLVLGSSPRSGTFWGRSWWAVYDPSERTLGKAVADPNLAYPSEESWRVALPRAQGGWQLVLPDALGALELLQLGPEGAIEARHKLEGPRVEPRSFGVLLTSGPDLWLVSGRQSMGSRESVYAWRLDPGSGRVLEERTALLPAGLWVHATHVHDGALLLGGALAEPGAVPAVVTLQLKRP